MNKWHFLVAGLSVIMTVGCTEVTPQAPQGQTEQVASEHAPAVEATPQKEKEPALPVTKQSELQNRKNAQRMLNAKGYEAGAPDGVIGKKTRAAIEKFQRENSLAVTGTLNIETMNALRVPN